MGPHVDLLKRKEGMTEEERRITEQRKGRKKEADEREERGEREERLERPTNQKQEEKKAKRAKEGWKGQRTQGRVLPRAKAYEGKRKKLNEELRIPKERKECDNAKEN